MATKRKKTSPRKAAPAAAPKPRKPRKRKATKRRKRAAAAPSGGSSKRTRRPLQLVLRVEDVPINSPALARLSDSQRVDLAALDARKARTARPAWALDESIWRRALRTVRPHWARLRNPWPTVAWVYLHSDGPVATDGRRGFADRENEEREGSRRRAPAARARATTASTRSAYDPEDEALPVRVERLQTDETGIDENGIYRGRGLWWRVWNASMDSVVRAASAAAARAIVTGRAH